TPKSNAHILWPTNEKQIGADDLSNDFSNKWKTHDAGETRRCTTEGTLRQLPKLES
ncbi:hypothetical protein PIB30_064796, partial [Stylosanthes scabra]|nr:hypothetical protein [Stylosanthes scabra]